MKKVSIFVVIFLFGFLFSLKLGLSFSYDYGGLVYCICWGDTCNNINVPEPGESVSCGWFDSCGSNEFCCEKGLFSGDCYSIKNTYTGYYSCPYEFSGYFCANNYPTKCEMGTPYIIAYPSCYCRKNRACFLNSRGVFLEFYDLNLHDGNYYPYDTRCRGYVKTLGNIKPEIVDSREYCDGDERWKEYKYRQLVVWNEIDCDYSVSTWWDNQTFLEDCETKSGWYHKDNVWSCVGSYKRCYYDVKEYRDYTCVYNARNNKETFCDYLTPYPDKYEEVKCETSQTYWKGGGNVRGFNDPPSYEYRQVCSDRRWEGEKTGRKKDCDDYDVKRLCRYGDVYSKDAYVKKNSNICKYEYKKIEDCQFCKDSDGGKVYNVKGSVDTKEGCKDGNCIKKKYEDYCDDKGNLIEYYCSGTRVNFKSVTPGNGQECIDGKIEKFVSVGFPSNVEIIPGEFLEIKFNVTNEYNFPNDLLISIELDNGLEKVEPYKFKVNGKEVRYGKRVSFERKEKREIEVILFVPENITQGDYIDLILNIKSRTGKYTYRKTLEAEKIFVNLSLNAKLESYTGEILRNSDVRVCICRSDKDYCDVSNALKCWVAKTDGDGMIRRKFRVRLGYGRYKLSIVTVGENGYAETEFEIKKK